MRIKAGTLPVTSMKVVFINRYFYPDHSATSQLLSELAFDLASAGREVHVIAGRQLYDDPNARLEKSSAVDGVRIRRLWTTRFGRQGLFGRSIDYLTFYLSAGIVLARVLRKDDIVVAKTDPPLISVVAAIVARMRGAVLVNWLQDVFPEVAERLGIRVVGGGAGVVARYLRDFSMRHAAITVVVGDRMAEEVLSGSVPKDRIRVIHNWADADNIKPMHELSSDSRRKWGLGKQFVVAYSGNMGRAHEFETIVSAIELLRDEEGLSFLFIGGGNQTGWLHSEVTRRGLAHRVHFHPYQPRERLSDSLGAAQVHLVTLHPSLEGLIVPSKFYGIAAAGRATIFVGDPKGEISNLLARHDCGRSVPPGDGPGLAATILKLKNDADLCNRLGANARDALCDRYDRRRAITQWAEVLDEAASIIR